MRVRDLCFKILSKLLIISTTIMWLDSHNAFKLIDHNVVKTLI